jgi:two-component system response regulator FixJ
VNSGSTIFIIDDDPLIRGTLKLLVDNVGHTSATFDSATAFLDVYQAGQPGCVISDICMPGLTGLDLQTELNRLGATIPVIFISGQSDVPTAVAAMRQGAFDFLVKPFPEERLLERVAAAVIRDEEVRLSMREFEQVRVRHEQLTPRELAVLERLVKGMPNKVISEELSVSIRTVELHRSHVMEKMGARSIAQLVRMMMEAERGTTDSRS